MDFSELLEALRNPGDDGLPDGIYDDLQTAYQDATSTSAAKISQLDEQLQSAVSELSRAKAHNYDLLMSQSQNDGGNGGDGGDGGSEEPDVEDGDIDSLFSKGNDD